MVVYDLPRPTVEVCSDRELTWGGTGNDKNKTGSNGGIWLPCGSLTSCHAGLLFSVCIYFPVLSSEGFCCGQDDMNETPLYEAFPVNMFATL